MLNQIQQEFDRLNKEISGLKKENKKLKDKLEKIQDGQTDIFSALTESERIALRNQVLGLISKIDSHLEEEQE